MTEMLSENHLDLIRQGYCPDCNHRGFVMGPRAMGTNTNIECGNLACRARFNVACTNFSHHLLMGHRIDREQDGGANWGYKVPAATEPYTFLRTVRIPRHCAPFALMQERRGKYPNALACACCELPVPSPEFWVHIINGGGEALYAEDEQRYTSDGADLGCYPVGPECAKKYPVLKPCLHQDRRNPCRT